MSNNMIVLLSVINVYKTYEYSERARNRALTNVQRKLIVNSYFSGMTQAEIADAMYISQVLVSSVINKAIDKATPLFDNVMEQIRGGMNL